MKYADVIIDISHEKLDKTFQYIIPAAMEETLVVGMLVHVPFVSLSSLVSIFVIFFVSLLVPEEGTEQPCSSP